MTTTLTDRYVWAVTRLLPEGHRHEIDRELRSLIADMVDERAGASSVDAEPAEIERDVLVELGDPGRLAARYVERPRALVSQEVFPEYLRMLKLVLAIAVPALAALAALGAAFGEDPGAGDVVGAAIGAAVEAVVQVAFWVTLVYAFADRWKANRPWTPDDLPDVPETSGSYGNGDVVFGMIVTVLTGVALVWQHVRPPLADARGEGVPVLHPDLWDGAGQVLLAVLGASLVVQAFRLARRHWTHSLAAVNAAVNAAFVGAVAWLALDDRLINARFLELLADRGDLDQVPTVNPWIPIVIVAAIEIWDGAAALLAARRHAVSRTAPVSGR